MRVEITRDSVSLGDDIDAPHAETHQLAVSDDLEKVVAEVLAHYPLPRTAPGPSYWCLRMQDESGRLGEELAQLRFQWPGKPEITRLGAPDRWSPEKAGGAFRLHFEKVLPQEGQEADSTSESDPA